MHSKNTTTHCYGIYGYVFGGIQEARQRTRQTRLILHNGSPDNSVRSPLHIPISPVLFQNDQKRDAIEVWLHFKIESKRIDSNIDPKLGSPAVTSSIGSPFDSAIKRWAERQSDRWLTLYRMTSTDSTVRLFSFRSYLRVLCRQLYQ